MKYCLHVGKKLILHVAAQGFEIGPRRNNLEWHECRAPSHTAATVRFIEIFSTDTCHNLTAIPSFLLESFFQPGIRIL